MAELGTHEAFEQALDQRGAELWADALLSVELLCLAGASLGGLWLKARSGGVRELFLSQVQERLGQSIRWVRLPPGGGDRQPVGGIDLAATAAMGRLQHQPGLLKLAEGGVLLVPMAERLDPSLAAMVASAMDKPSGHGFLLIAIDESLDEETALSGTLGDRLALRVDLDGIGWHHVGKTAPQSDRCRTTDGEWRSITIDDRMLKGLALLSQHAGHRSPRILAHLARNGTASGLS